MGSGWKSLRFIQEAGEILGFVNIYRRGDGDFDSEFDEHLEDDGGDNGDDDSDDEDGG
jgi:hypothetical protein